MQIAISNIDILIFFGKLVIVFLFYLINNPYLLNKNHLNHLNFSMKTASNEFQKLKSIAEISLNKTAELQQVLAQIEATLIRAETQKVNQKTNKI